MAEVGKLKGDEKKLAQAVAKSYILAEAASTFSRAGAFLEKFPASVRKVYAKVYGKLAKQ